MVLIRKKVGRRRHCRLKEQLQPESHPQRSARRRSPRERSDDLLQGEQTKLKEQLVQQLCRHHQQQALVLQTEPRTSATSAGTRSPRWRWPVSRRRAGSPTACSTTFGRWRSCCRCSLPAPPSSRWPFAVWAWILSQGITSSCTSARSSRTSPPFSRGRLARCLQLLLMFQLIRETNNNHHLETAKRE